MAVYGTMMSEWRGIRSWSCRVILEKYVSAWTKLTSGMWPDMASGWRVACQWRERQCRQLLGVSQGISGADDSGRIGASVLQTDDGVPKATAKWTKRNHTAAVKVCPSSQPLAPLTIRLSHGVPGKTPSSPPVVDQQTSTSTSGPARPEHVPTPSRSARKSPRSSSPRTQRSYSRRTGIPITISPCGRIRA